MDPVNAQLQIRRDAEERSAAHQDLGSFLDVMKNKSSNSTPAADRKSKVRSTSSNKSTALPSIDEPSANDSSCDAERLRGNIFMTEGKYQDAIQCYSRCLGNKDALATPLVYSNRGE